MQSTLMTFLILTMANEGVDVTTMNVDSLHAAPAAQVAARSESGSESRPQIEIDEKVIERWTRPPYAAGPLPVDAAELRARLGSRRSRELREANFHVRRFELNPTRDLTDDPIARERVEEILSDGLIKLVRVSIEHAIDLDRRVERLRPRRFTDSDGADERSRRTRGFRVSPNLWLGDDTAYGFRMRPRTAHPLWSRTSLEVRQYTESDATQLRVKYARGDRLFMLEHRFGDRFSGDSFGLLMRTSF